MKSIFNSLLFLLFFLVHSAHAQSVTTCSDLREARNVEVASGGAISFGIRQPRAGETYIFSITPGTATEVSWGIGGTLTEEIIPLPPYREFVTGGTLSSNTLAYTATGAEWDLGPFVSTINGTATLSVRCQASARGIPTLSQWGLLGTGLLLTLTAALHFRTRRRFPQ